VSSRFLYLNTHHLSAYAWQSGRLLPEGVFAGDDDGLRQFAEYLAGHRGSRFSLLANVAEESHVQELIPFLRGSDRQALITRKIGQHFQGTALAAVVSLGYEKSQRKNERVLLSALTNPAHFAPWLQAIDGAEAPLAGIYTVAQLGGLLLKKIGQPVGRCLLLTLQDQSIRESYLVDGRTHFSRMAPLTDSSIAGIARSFAAEAGKLHQYLIGQRLIGRDETLPVFIIAHPLSIPAIENACPEHGHLNFTIIDSHAAAAQLKLHTPPEDNRSDQLFLHLLATAPPGQQFAGEAPRHHFRLAQIRHGLIAAGLVAVLGGALFAAKNTVDAHALREEAGQLKAEAADLGRRYQEISATFPQLGVDNDTLRRLTGRYGELLRQQRQPGPAYAQVSRVLDRMPAIVLEGIDWKIGQNLPSTVAFAADSPEITTVRASIRLERADTRQTLAVFEQFVDALKAEPGVTVKVLQRPFDVESGTALRGGDGIDETAQARPFAVEIVRSKAP
jgi:hypothetical protein